MTRDALQLLSDANPVPTPADYSDAVVRDRIAAIIDPLTSEVLPRGHRPRVLAALAAACVLGLAVVTAVVAARHDEPPAGPVGTGSTTTVTCAVRPGHVAQARAAITTRLAALGGARTSVRPGSGSTTLTVTTHGIDAATAQRACAATTTSIRPLIAPAVAVNTTGPHSPDPLARLPFPVPTSETGFARLTTGQRAQLRTAMARTDCTRAAGYGSAALVCDSAQQGVRTARLLGTPLVDGTGLTQAAAQPPDVAGVGGSAEWTVRLELGATASSRLADWTRLHHSDSQTASDRTCSSATVPCSDFLAFTVGPRVESVPLTMSEIGSRLSVAGAFTATTARELATDYLAAIAGLRPS